MMTDHSTHADIGCPHESPLLWTFSHSCPCLLTVKLL